MLKSEAPSTTQFEGLARQYRDNLLRDVIPFWLQNSLDKNQGGYFTCLDRQVAVYDTDKFMWLHARQVWPFSMLYNRCERREDWLRIARHGVEFLLAHGMDEGGNWYFSLNREGQPLIQPYNIFSDCFAAMALSQYALAAGDEELVPAAIVNAILDGENPVRVWRQHRGMSQVQLAEAADISQAYLAQIETRKREGTLGLYRSLADVLGVDLDDLVG